MLDPDTLELAQSVLDNEGTGVDGRAKLLRYFTAEDCRRYKDQTITEIADVIVEAGLTTLGEAVAREQALAESGSCCVRCHFEQAVTDLVFCGELIEQHGHDCQSRLTEPELKILALAREWVAEDTIAQCLEDGDE